jgi:hypothetical protein
MTPTRRSGGQGPNPAGTESGSERAGQPACPECVKGLSHHVRVTVDVAPHQYPGL